MAKDRRRKKRHKAIGPIHFCCSDDGENPSSAKKAKKLTEVGIVMNVSDDGICFMTTCPLKVGQTLVIRCPWQLNETEEGIVRWCRNAAADLWRIGLQKRTNGEDPSSSK